MYIQCRRHYRDPKLQFGHISRHLKVFLSTSIFGVGAHNHNHIIMEGSSNRPQLDFDGSSSSAAEQQRSPYHAQAKSQHLSSSSSSVTCDSSARFDSVPRPINIIGDVLSRGRDEMKEGIRSLNQLQQTQALKQQGGVHVQNIKNLGSKLQKGDTKVQEGLRTLGSKLQQNVVGLASTEQQQASKKVVQDGIRSIGTKIQQINIANAVSGVGIGGVGGGGFTDDLQSLHAKIQEDKEFHTIKREAEEACLHEMRVHLEEFLKTYPESHYGFHPRYDEWIENLHPENAYEGKLISGLDKEIDLRFFLEESDHRKLWNQYAIPERHVKPRNQLRKPGGNSLSSKLPYSDDPTTSKPKSSTDSNGDPEIVDLLSGATTTSTTSLTAPVDQFDNLFGETPTTMLPVPDSTTSAPLIKDFFGEATTAQTSDPSSATNDHLDELFGSHNTKESSLGATTTTRADPNNLSTTDVNNSGNTSKGTDGDLINFL